MTWQANGKGAICQMQSGGDLDSEGTRTKLSLMANTLALAQAVTQPAFEKGPGVDRF